MIDSLKKPEPAPKITFLRFLTGYLLPGLGLLALAFLSASSLPGDVLGLGSFLCFFTAAVTLVIEGVKRMRGRSSAGGEKP